MKLKTKAILLTIIGTIIGTIIVVTSITLLAIYPKTLLYCVAAILTIGIIYGISSSLYDSIKQELETRERDKEKQEAAVK